MSQLIKLRDVESGSVEFLDQKTGVIYADIEGAKKLREMEPTEYVLGENGKHVRGRDGRYMHASEISDAAAICNAREIARSLGRPVMCRLYSGEDRLVTMDLAPSDVHTNAALANYAAGYHIADGMADAASPVVMVPNQSDVYYTWNSDNDFKRKIPNAGSPGGEVPEVNPGLANSTYSTVQYALSGYLPTEVQSNADAPLQPFSKLVQMIVDGLRLEREIRVAGQLQTSANWQTSLVQTLTAGQNWNGGASSDPIANLHTAIESSFMPVTGIVWSEQMEHYFVRHPGVQKYIQTKPELDALPAAAAISETFKLPPIFTAKMKYSLGGSATYVWGKHVVLLHQPKEMPPVNQMEVATAYTMRWNGGEAPDGTLTAGFLVRTYFDPKRGGRGGTRAVVIHNDSEQQTSGYVGSLILNAIQ